MPGGGCPTPVGTADAGCSTLLPNHAPLSAQEQHVSTGLLSTAPRDAPKNLPQRKESHFATLSNSNKGFCGLLATLSQKSENSPASQGLSGSWHCCHHRVTLWEVTLLRTGTESLLTGMRCQGSLSPCPAADGHTSGGNSLSQGGESHVRAAASGLEAKIKPFPQVFSLLCKFIFVVFLISTELLE